MMIQTRFCWMLIGLLILLVNVQAEKKRSDFLGVEYGDYVHPEMRVFDYVGKGRETVSLAGEWTVALDPDKRGMTEKWYEKALSESLNLPGTLDDAKKGNPNGERLLRCLVPRYTYVGSAWYQKTFTVPEGWGEKNVFLFLERVMWESSVWVNGVLVGNRDSISTPHEYNLSGVIRPGQNRICIRVDNTHRPGASSHGYGDDQQIRWNGVIGRLELIARDKVGIQSVQIYSQLKNKRVVVQVAVDNAVGASASGMVSLKVRPKNKKPVAWGNPYRAEFLAAGETLPVEIAVPMGDSPIYWSEFNPQLYEVMVEVSSESGAKKYYDQRVQSFGFREISYHGTQLGLNGNVVYLRGTHDGGGFPLTGYPAMDVESWRKIFKTCKDYGLNHVRYHSFTPSEAAFTAADEEGIILMTELPVWTTMSEEWAGTAFSRAELLRILDAYGNHPSFVMMSLGNENSGDWDVLARMVEMGKRHDGRHAYTASANQYIRMGKDNRPINPGDDLAVIMQGVDPSKGRIRLMERLMEGQRPDLTADFRDLIKDFQVPVIAHELGQWWVYPKFDEIQKYRGALRSTALEMFKENAEKTGLDRWNTKFQKASGAMAVDLYKEDIERIFRTPGIGGFQLLDLHDYSGQNTSLIGLLDAFWESKGIVTPEAFRKFCAPTVILASIPKLSWELGDRLVAGVQLCHYGDKELLAVKPQWKVVDDRGKVIANGVLPLLNKVDRGGLTSLGEVNVDLKKSGMLKLVVSIGSLENEWKIAVMPKSESPDLPANVKIVRALDPETLEFVNSGGKVLYLGHESSRTVPIDFPNPIWNPFGANVQTCGLLIEKAHPCFQHFPTLEYTTWQWWDLLEPDARAFVMNQFPKDFSPIIHAIDQPIRAMSLSPLFEVGIGKGRLVACSLDLESDLKNRSVAKHLKTSLLSYLASNKSQTIRKMTVEEFSSAMVSNRFFERKSVPESTDVVLDVDCAKKSTHVGHEFWSKAADHIHVMKEGFDYSLPVPRYRKYNTSPLLIWRRGEFACWMGNQLTVEINCPKGFSGQVYFHFQDVDSGKARGTLQFERDVYYFGEHQQTGKWVGVKIRPEDSASGILSFFIERPSGGGEWSHAPRLNRVVMSRSNN